MPHVLIQYEETFGRISKTMLLNGVKNVVRNRAPAELATSDLPITGLDFGFMCLKAGSHDELIKDVQVIIMAHADEERLLKDSDSMAKAIGDGIAEMIGSLPPQRSGDPGDEITFSVSIFMGEMGYYASSAHYLDESTAGS